MTGPLDSARPAWGRLHAGLARPGPAMFALSVFGAIYTAWFFGIIGREVGSAGYDAFAYWDVRLDDLYGRSMGNLTAFGAFRYSPPVAMALAPLHGFAWTDFFWVLSCLLVGTLAYLGGRWTLAVLAFPGIAVSLYEGNIDLFLAASVAVGIVSPIAWVFPLLTKPTMAVCLLWFAVRREWRALAVALGATTAIVLVSAALRPDLWTGYFAMLGDNARLPTGQELGPLWLRLPAAAILVVFAARTDRPWIVALAAALAQPLFGLRSASVALGAVYLWRHRPVGARPGPRGAGDPRALGPEASPPDLRVPTGSGPP